METAWPKGIPRRDALGDHAQVVGGECGDAFANVLGAEDAFDQFLRHKLLSLGIVSDCESHIVTRGVKNVTALPLGIVTPHVG